MSCRGSHNSNAALYYVSLPLFTTTHTAIHIYTCSRTSELRTPRDFWSSWLWNFHISETNGVLMGQSSCMVNWWCGMGVVMGVFSEIAFWLTEQFVTLGFVTLRFLLHIHVPRFPVPRPANKINEGWSTHVAHQNEPPWCYSRCSNGQNNTHTPLPQHHDKPDPLTNMASQERGERVWSHHATIVPRPEVTGYCLERSYRSTPGWSQPRTSSTQLGMTHGSDHFGVSAYDNTETLLSLHTDTSWCLGT